MSKVLSLRLKDDQVARLQRAARQLGRRPSEAAALLLEESLREREFAFIEFRQSLAGRQAYLKGTRLAVWWAASSAKRFGGDPVRMAAEFGVAAPALRSALSYAAAYPAEIEAAMQDGRPTVEEIKRLVPDLELREVDAAGA